MKTLKTFFYLLFIFITSSLMLTSCESDDDNSKNQVPDVSTAEFTLQSPYLVCANRNPGGVGFDFIYEGEKGGADNMDNIIIPSFTYDTKIRTIKCEKPDGSLAGMPFLQLASEAQAVNYTAIDPSCIGLTGYNNLTTVSLEDSSLSSDDPSFDLSPIESGSTGNPLIAPLTLEMNKLVIGVKWKDSAFNSIPDDEIVWLIKTREGQLVKFIVTDFPADPAPTTSGYVALLWDLVQ